MQFSKVNSVSIFLYSLTAIFFGVSLAVRIQNWDRNIFVQIVFVLVFFLLFLLDRSFHPKKQIYFPLVLTWLVILGLFVSNPYKISKDNALFLTLGQRVLHGEIPYIDFMDINSPTISYLNAGFVWLSEVVGANPIPVFFIIITLLSLLVSYVCGKLLYPMFPETLAWVVRVFPLAIAFVGLISVLENEYGQREYLFILLFFPWLLFRWSRWQGNSVKGGWLVGLMCAVAVTIKPHFLLYPIILEIYWIIEYRSFKKLISIEWGMLVLCAIPYSAVLFLSSDFQYGVFDVVFPMLMSGGYASYGSFGLSNLLISISIQAVPLIVLTPWFVRGVDDPKLVTLLRTISVYTFAAILVYFIQDKGWYYHFIPVLSGVVLILLIFFYWFGGDKSSGSSIFQRIPISSFMWLLLLVPMIIFIPLDSFFTTEDMEVEIAQELVTYSQQGDAVVVVSNTVTSYVPIVKYWRRNVSTYFSAFPVAIEYYDKPYVHGASPTGFAEKYIDALQEDILTHMPELILVEKIDSCRACPDGFTYADFLDEIGFTANILEMEYTQIELETDYFEVWVLAVE